MALATAINVIAIATALKDIIELAQDIHEAFKKGPQNYRDARSLALDIESTVQKMDRLYSQQRDNFANSPGLEEALLELRQDMENVCKECQRLVPPLSERKRDRFWIAIYSLQNRNKVANIILELKRRIDKHYQEFMVLSMARTESTSHRIEAAVNRIVSHGTTFSIQSQSVQEYLETSISSPSISQLSVFNQKNSISTASASDTLAVQDPYTNYLLSELGKTEKKMLRLESKHFYAFPDSHRLDSFQYSYDFWHAIASNTLCQQQIIVSIYGLQSMLSTTTPCVICIVFEVLSISYLLDHLGMNQESKMLQNWGVNIWKRVSIANSSAHMKTRYVRALTDFAFDHYGLREYGESYVQSSEATTEIHRLTKICRSVELEILMAKNLVLQADSLCAVAPNPRCSTLANRAVDVMQQALGIYTLDLPIFKATYFQQPQLLLSAFDAKLANRNLSPTHLCVFAQTLEALSRSHSCNNNDLDALRTSNHAMSIVFYLLRQYPNSNLLLHQFQRILRFIVTHNLEPALDDKLLYVKEYTSICHKILQHSESSSDFLQFCTALGKYREILLSAGKLQEAQSIYKEIVELSKRASAQYFDLTLPSESQGTYYLGLASVQNLEGHNSDAIYSARNAVAQYSALNALYPDRPLSEYIEAVTLLLKISNDQEQLHHALTECYNTLKYTDSEKHTYDKLLQNILEALEHLKQMGLGSLTMAIDAEALFHALFVSKSNNPNFLHQYLQCLYKRSKDYSNQGLLNKAREYSTHALAIAQKYSQHRSIPRIRDIQQDINTLHVELQSHYGQSTQG